MNKEAFIQWLEAFHDRGKQVFPLLMGILNVTPDSFSDGGRYISLNSAVDKALSMVSAGADVIDIGGVSSRPGAQSVSVEEELHRVIPVISAIREETDICISVDTFEPLVMQAAIEVGASIINDVYALRQPGALTIVRDLDVPVCLMHMQGTPATMQVAPTYSEGLRKSIHDFFVERIAACLNAGIKPTQLIIDPGIGFGKTTENNLLILKELNTFNAYGYPVLLGVSRKQFLGALLVEHQNSNTKSISDSRLIGSITAAICGLLNGAHIVRMHDVQEMREAMTVIKAIRGCM